jgi:hypothetical protein
MKHLLFLLILGLLVMNPCPGLAQHPGAANAKPLSPLEQQLIANEKALAEAQKKKDVEYLKKTFTDDFVVAGADGRLHSREEVIGDAYEVELKEYTPYDIEVVPLNESAAVVTYDAIIAMAKYDEEIPRYQHISSVWVKQGEQWRLKFQQATPHVF